MKKKGSMAMRGTGLLGSLIVLVISTAAQAAEAPSTPATTADAEGNKAIEARIGAATQLGPQHAALAKYLGKWDVDIALPRMNAHAKGTAEYSWVIEGRWLGCRIKGTMLGQPFEEFTILGYDSYAQSVVEVSVESADNSMVMSRGSPTDSKQSSAVLFGELDEYTRGSLHRPFKVVERWLSDSHHVTEVWDLGAGEAPVQKVTFSFTKAK
jgi:Protein of unknown function (DUF1579)